MSQLHVNLGPRSYDIAFGQGLLAGAAEFFEARTKANHLLLITDDNVEERYAIPLADACTEHGFEADVLVVAPGEQTKCADIAAQLWQTMIDEGCDRQSAVVAVGGGVVGDLAGFVAATFARGLNFFQVPTTLLAQVDSSVGGKVGINLIGAKNMVGAFWQPQGVLIDVDVLDTLPEREYRAGLAEVVKYGVILDAEFFAYLEQHIEAINARDKQTLLHIIRRSCELKAQVVEADELELTGIRAALNYGHTFGHALEAATNYERLLHGEAVAIGMMGAARLAVALGRMPADFTPRQEGLLTALGLPTATPADLDPDELWKLMWHDKKVRDGEIRFVLPSRIGAVEVVSGVTTDQVLQAWSH